MVNSCVKTGMHLKETDFGYTLSLILYWLEDHHVVRFNELQRNIETIFY